MRRRAPRRLTPSASAAAALAMLLTISCNPIGTAGIVLLSPLIPVTGFDFLLAVSVGGLTPSSTVDIRVNDMDVGAAQDPNVPGLFMANMSAGPPLQDVNLISVLVLDPNADARLGLFEFDYVPPKARVFQITDPNDLLTGPLAHNRLGDWMIENSVAQFVVQDAGQRDLYSVGAFGGNLIDAAVPGRPGLENYLEIAPMLNIETVINAVPPVEIVNDGQDGTAAILRTCGPDDLLDFVNPSSFVGPPFTFPALADDTNLPIDACTEYALEPLQPYVKMETTIFNNDPNDLALLVGDWINAGGELEQWGRPGEGIGEGGPTTIDVMSWFGFGDAEGVDYGYTTVPTDELPLLDTTFIAISGVNIVLHNANILFSLIGAPPSFIVPAGGSNSFVRYFSVGDGSGSNAADMAHAIKGVSTGTLSGCVTVASVPAPGARVAAGVESLGEIGEVVAEFVTDPNGCYSGTLPVGSYSVAAARLGTPYEGGGSTPTLHPVTITDPNTEVVNIDLPATGRLRVTVVDEADQPLPARVSVVGFDPSPELFGAAPTVFGFGGNSLGLFSDAFDHPPFGVARVVWSEPNGVAEFDLEPSTYQVFVSRGSEYSSFDTAVSVTSGPMVSVAAKIARVLDTTGFVSSDFHVHGIASADSRITDRRRVMQFAGEGIENPIMTDHHAHTDLKPTIAALGYAQFLTATIGEEITTFDYGHFNAYPLTIDPNRPSGGSTDWAGAAPAGMDFPSDGAFNQPPQGILDLATTGPQSTAATTAQVNHIDSHFEPLLIDTALVPPASLLDANGVAALRLDASDPNNANLFAHFPALELWNGDNRGDQSQFLTERIGIWFNLLNQGLFTTFIADTDTHQGLNLGIAGARTWTASPTDDPNAIASADVAASVDAGRATGGQGIYLQTRLISVSDPNQVADLTWSGSTLVSDPNGNVDLEISIQAPLWAEYDTVEIYANAATVRSDPNNVALYKPAPGFITHSAGVDFTVTTVNVFPAIPGASRLETTYTVPFTGLSADTWFVVVVKGTDGFTKPMFPVYPDNLDEPNNTMLSELIDGNLGESGVIALGASNALYADVDGTPGFQPPLTP